MHFSDVPNLQKFERHARNNSENEVVMDCYKRIREIITPAPPPPTAFSAASIPVETLKASCEAVEKLIRLVWACAAATDNIQPPLWQFVPDYEESLRYFHDLSDLELMALTQLHRVNWEQ